VSISERLERIRSWLARGLASCGACLVLTHAPSARAYHTDEERITDDTADTQGWGDWRLGIFKLEFTPLPGFTVGTYLGPWAFPAPNVHAKFRFLNTAPLSLAIGAGFTRFNARDLFWLNIDDSLRFYCVPVEAVATAHVLPWVSVSAGAVWTTIAGQGQLPEQGTADGALNGAATNLQFHATIELRLSRVTALLLHARYLPYQNVAGSGIVTLRPDEYTTLEIHGGLEYDIIDMRNSTSLSASTVFSLEHFNLRLGLGYGNYNISGANIMVPVRQFYPDFDLYWTF
jgi:hypothetical protein